MAVNPVSWSTTAASNTAVGGVSIAEGTLASNLNNGERAIMAGVKEALDVLMGAKTSGGTANAQTLTSGLSLSAYAAGQAFLFEAGATNTGACTLAVDGLAAKAITDQAGNALAAGEITSGGFYLVAYESDGDDFCLVTPYQDVLTASSTHTLTNKTIDGDDNTVQDLAYSAIKSTSRTGSDVKLVTGTAGTANDLAIWNADGDLIDGPTPPSGTIVGTSDSQTLTNKTIGAATLSGTMSAADQIVDQPVLRDYGETVNALGSGGGARTIDLELGNVVTATVSASTVTWTFSNPPASGTAGSFTLILTNGGSQTVNWPASVDWQAGNAPALTSSGRDVLSFFTVDGGTIWYGVVGGLAFA